MIGNQSFIAHGDLVENEQVAEVAERGTNLAEVVAALRVSREVTHSIRHRGHVRELPSRETMREIMDDIMALIFPSHYGRPDLSDEDIDYFVGHLLTKVLSALVEQVRRSLLFSDEPSASSELPLNTSAKEITDRFISKFPEIRETLVSDLFAAYRGDPAATSPAEVLVCYVGMRAVIYYRLANTLYRLGARFVARLISGIAHAETGIDIHPAAEIGESFFIDHGTGIVIGETAIIGKNVRLYQAVTLGAKRFVADENGVLHKGEPRHPIIEDNVIIYAGATILGRITIGRNSTIGGNVWLTQSVPPDSNVTQAQMRQVGA